MSNPQHPQQRQHSWLERLRLDPRSLALFRIAIGLITMVNAGVRLTVLEFLPSVAGVLPRSSPRLHRDWAWTTLVWLPGSGPPSSGFPSPWAAMMLLALMVTSTLQVLWPRSVPAIARISQPVGDLFRGSGFRQRWQVFAPMPSRQDGWFEVRVRAPNAPDQRRLAPTLLPWATEQNPFRDIEVYRNQRQRKFFGNLRNEKHRQSAEAYLAYLCRQRRTDLIGTRFTPKDPIELELVFMQETSNPPPQPADAPVPMVKASLTCDG